MQRKFLISLFLIHLLFPSCSSKKESNLKSLYELVSSKESGIHFKNQIDYSEEFNVYTYRNFYNGAGVGVGDINNDNLIDIYICGNKVGNKLYLNRGNFKFEDITDKSGASCGLSWSTGISMVDINGDGWLDLYVSKSGSPGGERRKNELFINNGDMTFTESSKKWGLDIEGLSIQAVFFDYDRDNDLDCYLLTNSIKSVGNYDIVKDQRRVPDIQRGGNKLLRNTGFNFEDVSMEAGIYTSRIGFGLGVIIGDINKDDWQDIYVSNDFFEKDYLYINQMDGTFKESLETFIKSISMGSMGADLADINNDGYPDLFVTEMLPQSNERLKTKITYENWNRQVLEQQNGYYFQYPRNVLQLNNSNNTFSEIGRFAGVESTDWSWGALMFDMDNDGLKDIFVANGIFKDLLDQDYVNFMADPQTIRSILSKDRSVLKKMVDIIPSTPLSNFAFRNLGGLRFKNIAESWGLGEPGFSSGTAYADFDNDGDLDIVINNVNSELSLFRNRASEIYPENHYLKFILQGLDKNQFAFGTKITLNTSRDKFYLEQMPIRGFQSSVDHRPNFGLGNQKVINQVLIQWPNGVTQTLDSVKADQTILLKQPKPI